MGRYLYILACLLCFAVGGYVWKLENTGSKGPDSNRLATLPLAEELADDKDPHPAPPTAVLFEVDGVSITAADVEWEFRLHTTDINDRKELTPIPDLGARIQQELSPLKRRLAAALIERKLLYAFVKKDREFDLDDPARYTDCLEEWQEL